MHVISWQFAIPTQPPKTDGSATWQAHKPTQPHSLQVLGREELSSRLRKVYELQVSSAQKVKQLTAKLQVTVEEMGHSIDKEMHSEILQIMDKHKSIVEDTYFGSNS